MMWTSPDSHPSPALRFAKNGAPVLLPPGGLDRPQQGSEWDEKKRFRDLLEHATWRAPASTFSGRTWRAPTFDAWKEDE